MSSAPHGPSPLGHCLSGVLALLLLPLRRVLAQRLLSAGPAFVGNACDLLWVDKEVW